MDLEEVREVLLSWEGYKILSINLPVNISTLADVCV
jgi:hypothetical protein